MVGSGIQSGHQGPTAPQCPASRTQAGQWESLLAKGHWPLLAEEPGENRGVAPGCEVSASSRNHSQNQGHHPLLTASRSHPSCEFCSHVALRGVRVVTNKTPLISGAASGAWPAPPPERGVPPSPRAHGSHTLPAVSHQHGGSTRTPGGGWRPRPSPAPGRRHGPGHRPADAVLPGLGGGQPVSCPEPGPGTPWEIVCVGRPDLRGLGPHVSIPIQPVPLQPARRPQLCCLLGFELTGENRRLPLKGDSNPPPHGAGRPQGQGRH